QRYGLLGHVASLLCPTACFRIRWVGLENVFSPLAVPPFPIRRAAGIPFGISCLLSQHHRSEPDAVGDGQTQKSSSQGSKGVGVRRSGIGGANAGANRWRRSLIFLAFNRLRLRGA